MFQVFGKHLVKTEPFLVTKAFKDGDKHYKEGDVIWDGKPETISLGEWKDKKVAERFAENVRKNTDEKTWKIYIKPS